MPRNHKAVPRADREAAILSAAREEFVACGFEEATMASLARRAGMTAANVHYYFATKEALFASVVAGAYDELLARLDALGDPRERLRRYLRFHLVNHRLRAEFLGLAARSSEVADQARRRERWVATTVGELVADDLDAAVLTATVTGLVEAAAEPSPDAVDVLARAIERLSKGIP